MDDDGGSRHSQHGKPNNPVIVLRGNPTDEELAGVVAICASGLLDATPRPRPAEPWGRGRKRLTWRRPRHDAWHGPRVRAPGPRPGM